MSTYRSFKGIFKAALHPVLFLDLEAELGSCTPFIPRKRKGCQSDHLKAQQNPGLVLPAQLKSDEERSEPVTPTEAIQTADEWFLAQRSGTERSILSGTSSVEKAGSRSTRHDSCHAGVTAKADTAVKDLSVSPETSVENDRCESRLSDTINDFPSICKTRTFIQESYPDHLRVFPVHDLGLEATDNKNN